jgi:hypothetical protein
MNNPAAEFAVAACREFIRAGGTLREWRVLYLNAACQLSDDELALSRLNDKRHNETMREAEQLVEKMQRDLEQLTGSKRPPEK